MRRRQHLCSALAACMVPLVWVCVGCGAATSDLPATFPAAGTVVDASGQPLQGGSVEFQSREDQNLLSVAEIQDDGRFELTTYLNGASAQGAVPGEYQVTVHPLQLEHGDAESIPLRKLCTIEAGENEIPLKLPRRR